MSAEKEYREAGGGDDDEELEEEVSSLAFSITAYRESHIIVS